MLKLIRENWDKALFVVGLGLIVFGYGVAVGKWRFWPHDYLNQVADAAEDWRANWRHYTGQRSKYLLPTSHMSGSVTINDPTLAWPGYTFVTAYRDGRFGASLIDMGGRTVHKWDLTLGELFPEVPEYLEAVPSDWDSNIQGSTLLPNGDVVLDVFSTGMVRLDRCSRPVWVLPREVHHSIDLLPDGSMLTPIRLDRMTEPMAGRPRVGISDTGIVVDDGLALIDGNGNVLRTKSMLDAIHESGRDGILLAGSGSEARTRSADPVHMNDAEMLRPEMAGAFTLFTPGDIVVSFRSTNTIAVLDGESWEMKWSMTGQFHGQHDPDFLPNGNIMIYDNQIVGGGLNQGRSRVIEVDPVTQKIVWSYDGGDATQFYASSRGMQQPLPNGNVLISDPYGGRVFEVSRSAGDKIVWEYVNLVSPGWVGMLLDVARVDPATLEDFVGQSCS
jgi:hypothetical protein